MTFTSFALDYLAGQFPFVAPLLVAYFVGIVIAAARLRRHRRPALIAMAALATLFVVAIGSPMTQAAIMAQHQGALLNALPYLNVVAITTVALNAVAVVVLTLAVFAGRTPPQPPDE